jgi:hypothetical protein
VRAELPRMVVSKGEEEAGEWSQSTAQCGTL